VAAGALAVHVLDHHARGLKRPRFFDGHRERQRARELVVVGWFMGAQGDAHGLNRLAACHLEQRRFGLGCGVACKQLRHAPADGPGFEGLSYVRQRFEPPREGAALGRPPTPAATAFEGVGAQGGKAEFVDAVSEAVEGLADSEAEAAGAAGEAVQLGVELGEFACRGNRGFGEQAYLAWRGSWGFGPGTPHDCLCL
jgi:hypothetical protein